MSALPPWLAGMALYLALGLAVALLLHRAREAPSTVLTAVIAWPLLLSLVRRPAEQGLLAEVRAAVRADPTSCRALSELEAALEDARLRILRVDPVIARARAHAPPGTPDPPELTALIELRDRTRAGIEAAHQGLRSLHLQAAARDLLQGPALDLAGRLDELRARVAADHELDALPCPHPQPRTHPW